MNTSTRPAESRSSHPASESSSPSGDSPRFRTYRAALPGGWTVVRPVLVERRRAPKLPGGRNSAGLEAIEGRIFEPCLLLARPGIPSAQAVRELRALGAPEEAFLPDGSDRSRKPPPAPRAYALLRLDKTSQDPPRGQCGPGQIRVYLPLFENPLSCAEAAPSIAHKDIVVELDGKRIWPEPQEAA